MFVDQSLSKMLIKLNIAFSEYNDSSVLRVQTVRVFKQYYSLKNKREVNKANSKVWEFMLLLI